MNNEIVFTKISVDVSKRIRNLLIALELAILEVEIAQERIKGGLARLELPNKYSKVTDKSQARRLIENEQVTEKLMADIHFWLIAWGNINKLLRNLRKIMNDPKLDWIQERRQRWFTAVSSARNSLEHIDERVLKSIRISPIEDVYIAYHNRWVTVFGVKINFNAASFDKLANLKKDLRRWHSNLPTIWDRLDKEHGWKSTKL